MAYQLTSFPCLVLIVFPLIPGPAGQDPAQPRARAVVEVDEIDLGEIMDGDKPELKFTLRNAGSADLTITSVAPDCGCTVVKLEETDKVLRPGGSLELAVTFDSTGRSSGQPQKKLIRVGTNDPDNKELTLQFHALVHSLFRLSPSGSLHLQVLRRGDEARRTLDVFPGSVGKHVRLTGIETPESWPFTYRFEDIDELGVTGTRVRFRAQDSAPLGVIEAPITLHLDVEGERIDKKIMIQATLAGDLDYRPAMINLINQRVVPGRKLAPITITSTTHRALRILKVDGGPLLDFELRPGARPDRSESIVQPRIRPEAPSGPFAALIRITTDSLDQPIVSVPVYGNISGSVEIDPDNVILRDDGTVMGASRFVRLVNTRVSREFRIERVDSDDPLVAGKRGQEAGVDQPQVENLIVYLVGQVPPGVHRATLTVQTSLPENPTLKIPVTVLSASTDPAEVFKEE